jgi:hypothetical protein
MLKIIKSKETNQTAVVIGSKPNKWVYLKYLKDKINELATNSKNKNIGDPHRGIKEF